MTEAREFAIDWLKHGNIDPNIADLSGENITSRRTLHPHSHILPFLGSW